MSRNTSVLLEKVIIELKQLQTSFLEGSDNSGGTGTTGGATENTLQVLVSQTDSLETLLTEIRDLNENENYTVDLQEVTTDGSTDTNNVVSFVITLDGEGGTLNGIPLASGYQMGASNTEGGTITNSITYTVPTSGNQRVLIAYTRRV